MSKAVIFDLYETLITETIRNGHVEVSKLAERLGLPQEIFDREWSSRYQARMTGRLHDYSCVLREICYECDVAPPEEEITSMQGGESGRKGPII